MCIAVISKREKGLEPIKTTAKKAWASLPNYSLYRESFGAIRMFDWEFSAASFQGSI
jgi:hypothetical protein